MCQFSTSSDYPLVNGLIAESFITPVGDVFGVELLSSSFTPTGESLSPPSVIGGMTIAEKWILLDWQLNTIINQEPFLRKKGNICTLNLELDMIDLLYEEPGLIARLAFFPFSHAEINEDSGYPFNRVYLRKLRRLSTFIPLVMDDYGKEFADESALACGLFRAVKIDIPVFRLHVVVNTLITLVNRLKRRCPVVIVEGVETQVDRNAAIRSVADAMQGFLFQHTILVDFQTSTPLTWRNNI